MYEPSNRNELSCVEWVASLSLSVRSRKEKLQLALLAWTKSSNHVSRQPIRFSDAPHQTHIGLQFKGKNKIGAPSSRGNSQDMIWQNECVFMERARTNLGKEERPNESKTGAFPSLPQRRNSFENANLAHKRHHEP
jgi:hypothetical protein